MHRAALVLVLLVAVAPVFVSGCAHYTFQATADLAGPNGAAKAPATKVSDVEVWNGSAPGGIVIHGDTITATPESGFEIVGRAQVIGTFEPPLMFVLPGVVCGMLTFVGAPCALGYWFYSGDRLQ